MRIGIGHPGSKEKVTGYVLHDFSRAEEEWLRPLLEVIAREAPRLAQEDESGFMNALAKAVRDSTGAPPASRSKRARGPAELRAPDPGESRRSPFATLLARLGRR